MGQLEIMLHVFINKKVIGSLLFVMCFFVKVFGYGGGAAADSMTVSQLYEIENKVIPCEITFNAEVQTTQRHDGQNMFCNKRQVEYRITKTEKKLVIKRKVISSKNTVICEDKTLQMIYPDVTSTQLCGLLKPGKMKTEDMLKSKIKCSVSKSGDFYVLVLDKSGKVAGREETFMGETVSFDKCMEELRYVSSDGTMSLDVINEIVSSISGWVTQKNGSRHHVEIIENIVVLR